MGSARDDDEELEDGMPTLIREPGPARPAPAAPAANAITVISMKTPGDPAALPAVSPPVLPPPKEVKIRAISEMAHQTPPGGFGKLAPPRDLVPERRRGTTARSVTLVLGVIIVAGIVGVAIWWFAAAR